MNEDGPKKKILIVEDDMIISMVLEQMVQKLGFTVIDKVTTGSKAITLAAKTNPDIILMDIQLKGQMDGITAMEKIGESSSVPAIYITGNSDKYYLERAQHTNHIDYLVKPIQMKDLKKSLQKAITEL